MFGSQHERRAAADISQRDICPDAQQLPDQLGRSAQGGKHEGCKLRLVLNVHIDASFQQQFHDLRVPQSSRQHQGRVALCIVRVQL